MADLPTEAQSLAIIAARECKSLRMLINGNAETLAALDTTAKESLVAAINELKTALDSVGSVDLSGYLTISAASSSYAPLSGTAPSLVTGGSIISIITESTTARTLSATDIHKKIRYTNASGCAITIPNGIGVAGTIIIGRRATGAGALSFTLGGSVTVNNSGIASITAGQEFALMALSANEYDFI